MTDTPSDGLDLVIRMHHPPGLDALTRSVFAAALQDYQPVRIIIAAPGIETAARDALTRHLAPLMAIEPSVTLVISDGDAPLPHHRYIIVIAAGDVLYPEAAGLLIAEIRASGAAMAEGGMVLAWTDRDGVVPYVTAKTPADAPLLLLDRSRVTEPIADILGGTLPTRRSTQGTSSTRLRDIMLCERPYPPTPKPVPG